MRRVVIGLIVIIVVLTGLAWLSRDRLGEIVFNRAVEAGYGADATKGLPDGLHAMLCGTGSPCPIRTGLVRARWCWRVGSCSWSMRVRVPDGGSGK